MTDMVNWKSYVKEIAEEMGTLCTELPGREQMVIVSKCPIFVETNKQQSSMYITAKLLPVLHPAAEDVALMDKLVPVARGIMRSVDPGVYCDRSDDGMNIDAFYKIALEKGLPDKETFVCALAVLGKMQVQFGKFLDGEMKPEEMDLAVGADSFCEKYLAFTDQIAGMREKHDEKGIIEMCSGVMATEPDHYFALAERALYLWNQKRYEESLADTIKALGLWTPSFRFRRNVLRVHTDCLRNLERYDECVAAATEYLRHDPLDSYVLSLRADALQNMGMHDQALVDINAALSTCPPGRSNSFYLAIRAEIYRQEKRFAEAEADVNIVLKNSPDYEYAQRLLDKIRVGDSDA